MQDHRSSQVILISLLDVWMTTDAIAFNGTVPGPTIRHFCVIRG